MNLKNNKSRGAVNTVDSINETVDVSNISELYLRQDKLRNSAALLSDAFGCAASMMRGIEYDRK